MTAYATRSPLQLLTNTHAMGEPRRATRRTSARLVDKEDVPVMNGIVHAAEKGKSSQNSVTSGKHGKASVNGAATGGARGRGKRKHDYDEEDDGFMFTRTRSKRTKAAPALQQPEPVREEFREEAPKVAPAKSRRKKSFGTPNVPAPADQEAKDAKRRRSARNSGDGSVLDPPMLDVKKRRGKDQDPIERQPRRAPEEPKGTQVNGDAEESIEMVGGTSQPQPLEISRDTTKIALPFADTPIIRRNKEMRKGADNGHRRSSMGNRGRRASSLIDGGKSNGESKHVLEHDHTYADEVKALPHDEVESSEFYKHIESDLPEPRRMRQLLTWCGTRALGEKPSFSSDDSHARLAAREIQQQLLKDFSIRSDMSDWFSREDSIPNQQPPKPNPKNIANLAKIQDLQQQIAQLQSERQTWESLLQSPSPTASPTIPPLPITTIPIPSSIDSSVLPPSQVTALTTLQSFTHGPTIESSVTSRLQILSRGVEFQVDTFADNVHQLNNWVQGAERVADRVLQESARVLEERERAGRRRGAEEENGNEEVGREIGVREVLRGLSRVMDR